MWKDFFYFTRAERQGILILAVLCILVFVAGWLIPVKENTAKNDTEKMKRNMPVYVLHPRKEQKIYSHNNRFQPPRTVRLTTFDPNITDSVGFLDLGLPAWIAKNILKYRNKGGKFRRAEDFRKVYGLTQEQYEMLLPYIYIATFAKPKDTLRLYTRKIEEDTLNFF